MSLDSFPIERSFYRNARYSSPSVGSNITPQPRFNNSEPPKSTDYASMMTLGLFSLNRAWSQRSIDEQLLSTTMRRMKKKAIAVGADQALNKVVTAESVKKFLPERITKGADSLINKYNQFSYSGLFGIGRKLTSESPWSISLRKYPIKLAQNFRKIAWNPGGVNFTLGGYLKNTVVGNSFRRVADFARTGRGAVEGGIQALGLGFLALNVGLEAKTAYDASAAQKDDLSTKIIKTGVAGIKELGKSVVAFEAGGLAYALGYALCCFNPVTAVIGGIAASAVGSVFAYNLMNKILPRTKPVEKPAEQPAPSFNRRVPIQSLPNQYNPFGYRVQA